jgi:hypothetical protein
VSLLNLSLHLAAETSPYAWLMTNVHFVLLMMVSYELERRDLQVPTRTHKHRTAHDRPLPLPLPLHLPLSLTVYLPHLALRRPLLVVLCSVLPIALCFTPHPSPCRCF